MSSFRFIYSLLFVFVLATSAFAVNDAQVYHDFNDAGATIDDLSGNGNSGSYGSLNNNYDGILDSALYCDAANTAESGYNIPTGQDFSMCFWVNSTASGTKTLLGGQAASGDRINLYWQVSGGQLALEIKESGTGDTQFWGANTYDDGAWHHFCILMDDSAKQVEIFVNTSSIGSRTFSVGAPNFNSDLPLCAYDSGSGLFNQMTGTIDEFAVYDYLLSGSDMSDLYNAGAGFNPYRIVSNNVTVFVNDIWNNSEVPDYNLTIYHPTLGTINYSTTGNYSLATNVSINESVLANFTVTASNYFERNFTDVNLSSNQNFKVAQSRITFNASQLISNYYVDGNVTIEGVTQPTGTIFNLSAGLYNATFSSFGYYNTTLLVNISTKESSTYTIVNVTNAVINITAYDPVNGFSVSDFTVTIWNDTLNYTQTTVVSGDSVSFFTINNSFNINVSKDTYFANVSVLSVPYGNSTYNATIFGRNTVIFLFVDEISSLGVSNVEFELKGDSFSNTYTSNATNIFNITSLAAGDYEIRYGLNSSTLRPRSYFFQIPLQEVTEVNFTLRTINQSESQIFVRDVVNQNAQPLTNYLFELQRFYASTGNWVTVERAIISNQGEAVFSAVPNTQAYRYRILNNYSIVSVSDSAFYLLDTSSEITINTEQELLENFNKHRNLESSLTLTESSYIMLDYNDPSGQVAEVCLTLRHIFASTTVTNTTCSSEDSGALLLYVDQNQTGRYFAHATAQFGSDTLTIQNWEERFDAPTGAIVLGVTAWVLLVVLLIVYGTLSFTNPFVGLTGAVMTIMAFSTKYLGFIEVSTASLGGLLLVAVVMMFVVQRT